MLNLSGQRSNAVNSIMDLGPAIFGVDVGSLVRAYDRTKDPRFTELMRFGTSTKIPLFMPFLFLDLHYKIDMLFQSPILVKVRCRAQCRLDEVIN